MIKNKVYEKLKNQSDFISGEKIAIDLNVSRVAVNKAINSLKDEGIIIDSSQNKGYRLISDGTSFSESVIRYNLNQKDYYVKCFDEVESTNDIVKELIKTNDKVLVISESQTKGRGNRGRSFVSKGGVGAYFTIGLKVNIPFEKLELVTSLVSTYVSDVIDKLANTQTKIKWVNDIYLGGKKICGILSTAELNCDEKVSSYILIGIGINVLKNSFSKDLKDVATSIENELNIKIDRQTLVSEIVNKFDNLMADLDSKQFILDYINKSNLIGKEITVKNNDEIIKGHCIDIDDECRLVVKNGEKILKFRVGDVTMHL